MPRESIANIDLNPNIRCSNVYPIEGSKKSIKDLKTVGIELSREQAIHLARALLVATQNWDKINITGFRKKRVSDGTNHLTVTSFLPDNNSNNSFRE
jgi:hypothetical protein